MDDLHATTFLIEGVLHDVTVYNPARVSECLTCTESYLETVKTILSTHPIDCILVKDQSVWVSYGLDEINKLIESRGIRVFDLQPYVSQIITYLANSNYAHH